MVIGFERDRSKGVAALLGAALGRFAKLRSFAKFDLYPVLSPALCHSTPKHLHPKNVDSRHACEAQNKVTESSARRWCEEHPDDWHVIFCQEASQVAKKGDNSRFHVFLLFMRAGLLTESSEIGWL